MSTDAALLPAQPDMDRIEKVLVIKLGALGDFVLALGPFAAIREAHSDAHITLLTTAPFEELARASGYFDDVWVDSRPKPFAPSAWSALRRRLRGGGFGRVYDLQTADRTGWYFRLMGPGRRPEWSGIARGCSHPHDDPDRDSMHTVERQKDQLAAAGIAEVPPPDLSWMDADIERFELSPPFFLIVPGGAAHRPRKRWSAERYGMIAADVHRQGLQPVVIGGEGERELARVIHSVCAHAVSLAGRTSFVDIAALARQASGAVGNDTGPMHLIAAAGCPVLALFSDESDPAVTAPRGADVGILRRADLSDLPVAEVAAALSLR